MVLMLASSVVLKPAWSRSSVNVFASLEPSVDAVNREKRTAIFRQLQANNPAPTTELNCRRRFELLIAVSLSAQATEVGVHNAPGKRFAEANTPAARWARGLRKLTRHLKTLGLFN